MAGTADKSNPPIFELPAEFIRQLNLPPDATQRLKALAPPGLAQKLQQLTQHSVFRQLTPQVREMIALVLEKRTEKAAIEKELHRLELWLGSEIDRKLWDRSTAAAALEKIEPPPVVSAEQAKPVSVPAISEPPPAPSPPPPQEPTPIAQLVEAALAAPPSPSPPSEQESAPVIPAEEQEKTEEAAGARSATPALLPDDPATILTVLGLKGFQQEAIAEAVLELYERAPPESLTPGKLRKDLQTRYNARAAKAKARGDALPHKPAEWDACNDFVEALRVLRAKQRTLDS
jgi:hypothetical protein